jgi:hypothetical protein
MQEESDSLSAVCLLSDINKLHNTSVEKAKAAHDRADAAHNRADAAWSHGDDGRKRAMNAQGKADGISNSLGSKKNRTSTERLSQQANVGGNKKNYEIGWSNSHGLGGKPAQCNDDEYMKSIELRNGSGESLQFKAVCTKLPWL